MHGVRGDGDSFDALGWPPVAASRPNMNTKKKIAQLALLVSVQTRCFLLRGLGRAEKPSA